jgi:bifunctional hydroxylase/dehydrase
MDAPVIVVGAGPAGLVLAAELRLGGVEVIVLEKLDKPSGESRGLGFTARTLELFEQRGLGPRFGEVETSALGHFGGIPLDYSILKGAHFGARGIPQTRTEQVLGDWAAELGADIRRGHQVVGLTDHGDSVELEVDGPAGRIILTARYVVACDGGRSFVRGAAGFDFPGTDATMEMFLADVEGCNLPARQIGEKKPNGMVMSAPLGKGIDRIIVCEQGNKPQGRTGPPEFGEVADAWQRITGEDISGGTPHWVSSFGDATRHVSTYRLGSVLIAGDAAHVHLPAGGQGLSVSVQDTMNLGWKLAATVNGWAPADLLDTYHGERHPVGARLLINTRAQGMLYLSGSEVEPLRTVFAELMQFPEVGRHLAGMVSGFSITYDVGQGDHPLLGRRIPDEKLVAAEGNTSAFELLHTARGVLLDLADSAALRAAAAPWSDRVDVVTVTPQELSDDSPLLHTAAALIRPDGYVAWAVHDTDQDPTAALSRWFGQPSDQGA